MSVHIFIVHDSSIRCTPSNEESLKKMWYIQGRECCLAVQSNEVLMHAIVFMNLEKFKYKKPVTEGCTLNDSIYIKCLKHTDS